MTFSISWLQKYYTAASSSILMQSAGPSLTPIFYMDLSCCLHV